MRRAVWQLVLAAVFGVAGSIGLLADRAVAAGEAAGTVVVTKPTSSSRITRGGSATPFTLQLPKNSTCPGDSADDDYRVQTFLVPKGTNVALMRFKSEGPDVPDAWAVYEVTTSAYMQEFTDDAEGKRQPGAILPLPALNFAVFTGGELKPGRYEMGIACSLYNEMKKFWSTDIVIHADPDDVPAALRWELPGERATGSGTPFMAYAAGGVVLTAALAIFLAARRPA